MTPPRGHAVERGEGQVLAHRHRQHQPFGLAVLRDQRHADAVAACAAAGLPIVTGLPSTSTSPDSRAARRTSASSSSRWPWPSRPPRPTTSPALTRKRDVVQPVGPARACGLRAPAALPLGVGAGLGGKTWLYSRPIISSTTSSSVLRAGLVGRDVAAVAEHRALVGELGDLVHAVRDVEQRQPFGAQPLQHGEDLRDIGRRQRRGRLVEDQDARLARQRLGDLDHLPARQRQVLDQRAADGCRRRRRAPAPPRRCRRCAVRSIMPKRVGGSEMTMLSATLRSGISDSSWKMQTMPAALAAAGDANATSRPSSIMRPSSGATTPAMILISVDLPAPFSPRMAWMLPAATDKLGLLQRAHAAIALGYAFHAERAEPHASIGPPRHVDQRYRWPAPRESPRRRMFRAAYWFSLVCPMISCAVKLMPQVGKELPTKKLSDWSGK